MSLLSRRGIIMSKRILVTGGDGFIGWPFSLRASSLGWEVLIVDNLSRRAIGEQNGYSSITPIKTIQERVQVWEELTGKTIGFKNIDIAKEQAAFFTAFQEFNPDVVVHLAEQKAAPYSMKSIETIDYTISNNTESTKNLLLAIMKFNKDCHLVHIGTMGVYGYGSVEGAQIPEGFCMAKLNCTHTEKCQCESVEIVHPYYPGSVYHMTKCLDNVILLNFQKFFGLHITELHQGIVWGVSTPETSMHEDLVNRLDVDSDYGTVLNRFCSQVANGHPITLYGTGEQTRAFININDSMKCLELAIREGEKGRGEKVSILNQMTATHQLNDLKDMLLRLYPQAQCEYLENPRAEKAQNSLRVSNQKFRSLGLQGIQIDDNRLAEVVETCRRHRERFDLNLDFIRPISSWHALKQ